MARISKRDYYLEIAKTVALRSTCLRRQYGAVIVKDDIIIATGYNGAARGETNCCDIGQCWREANGIPHGERYEECVASGSAGARQTVSPTANATRSVLPSTPRTMPSVRLAASPSVRRCIWLAWNTVK